MFCKIISLLKMLRSIMVSSNSNQRTSFFVSIVRPLHLYVKVKQDSDRLEQHSSSFLLSCCLCKSAVANSLSACALPGGTGGTARFLMHHCVLYDLWQGEITVQWLTLVLTVLEYDDGCFMTGISNSSSLILQRCSVELVVTHLPSKLCA